MESSHPDLVISAATPADCRIIARLMLKRRAEEPRFQKVARSVIQRTLYKRWVAPRFLATTADTYRADLGKKMAGYLVLLFDHPSVVILDIVTLEGFKKQGIEEQLMAHADGVTRRREYTYLRAGLSPDDSYIAGLFAEQGYQPLQFRRWEFAGSVKIHEPHETIEGLSMRPLIGQPAMERQTHYLQAEMDAAQPAGRELIEAHYLPKRPSARQAFELMYEESPFGYLSAKKEGGTHALSLATLPEWWGQEPETAAVVAFLSGKTRTGQAEVSVRLESTAHADAATESFTALGLERTLVDPDIWFRAVGVGGVSGVTGHSASGSPSAE